MKIIGIIFSGLLLLCIHSGNCDETPKQWDDGPLPVEPYTPEFEVVSYSVNTGDVTLKMTITYQPEYKYELTCSEMLIMLYPFEGLINKGSDTLQIPYRFVNPFSTLLELNIPPNDTSYLMFWWECDDVSRDFGKAFVSMGDSLVTFWGTGGHHMGLNSEWSIKQYLKKQPNSDKEIEFEKQGGENKQEQIPKEGIEEDGVYILPDDSTYYNALSDKDKERLIRMRILERKMFTDGRRQTMFIDGICYSRDSGEYKFRIVPSETDEEIKARHQKIRESAYANTGTTQLAVCSMILG